MEKLHLLCSVIRKLIEYFIKNAHVKARFPLVVFETLLFEGRSVLTPAQRCAESESINQNLSDSQKISVLLISLLSFFLDLRYTFLRQRPISIHPANVRKPKVF